MRILVAIRRICERSETTIHILDSAKIAESSVIFVIARRLSDSENNEAIHKKK
ncbi:hypothetical protein ACWIUD_03895 [Helicobacter sp. 23-1044]